jgi:hypothetical protein
MVPMGVQEACDTGQDFFGRVVGEQALEPDLQPPGTFLIVPSKGRGHPPPE